MTYPDEESLLLSPFDPKFQKKSNKALNSSIPALLAQLENDGNKEKISAENCKNLPEPTKVMVTEEKKKGFPALGILMALMSVLCYSIGSAIVNLLPELHSLEILFIRSVFQFFYFTTISCLNQYPIAPAKGHRINLALRCISGTITLTTVFVAYRLMPLADASTIQFSSPVFVAIFAYFILKESLTLMQGLAGIITLIGVVIIGQPEFLFGAQTETVYDQRMFGTILAVVSSLSGALSYIMLRKLKTTPVAVIVMWYSGFVTIVCMVILIVLDALTWPQGWYAWGLLCAVGFCGIGDQYFLSKALQFESPGPISVTRTSTIVMTFIWEAVLLGQTIELMSIIGASIITSCILLLAIEKWRKESPQTFENLCNCCSYSADTDDDESLKQNKNFSDSFNSYYDSIEKNKSYSNHIYYNQFVLIDGSPNTPQIKV